MKIIHEPTIYVVGRQVIDQDVVAQFLDDHETSWITDSEVGAELLTEVAGRICYMSFGSAQGRKTNQDYLDNIIASGDGSVIEHAVWNFIISGVSRSFTHELIRHRAGFGYSQLSQRYVDESTADFVEPDIIAEDAELHAIWQDAIETSHRAYVELVERLTNKVNSSFRDLPRTDRRKMARQAARSVLPNATETKIFVSANARALRHFIELRGAPYADPEIRCVAVKMLELMQREAPNMFRDFETYELPDGSTGTRTPYHKV